MKVMYKLEEPWITLIALGKKKAIITGSPTEHKGTVSILDVGIDTEMCKRMGINPSKVPSKNGFIRVVMKWGSQKKISFKQYYDLRNEHISYLHEHPEFDRDNIYFIPILEARFVEPEFEYLKTYGEPNLYEDDKYLWKTSLEYEDKLMGRGIEKLKYFKSPVSSVNKDKTSDLNLYCHWHLALNPYLGCRFNCAYCLVKTTYGYNGMWTSKNVVPSRLTEILEIFNDGLFTTKNNLLSSLIRKRMPIKVGVSTDPLQPLERKEKITLGFMKYAKENNYPYILITKSDLAGNSEYINELVDAPVLYQQTIITSNEDLIRKLEPGAPSFKKRLETIKKLTNEGVEVHVRIEPAPMLGVNCNLRGNIDKEYYNEFIGTLAEAGVSHIMTRHYTRSPITDRVLKEKIGVDYEKEYKNSYIEMYGKLLTENPVIPEPSIYLTFASELREICDKHDLTFAPRGSIDMDNFTFKHTCCSVDNLSEEKRNLFLNNCNKSHHVWIHRILKENPGKVFTIDEIMSKLDAGVPKLVRHNLVNGWYDGQMLNCFPEIKDGKTIGLKYNSDLIGKYYTYIAEERER